MNILSLFDDDIEKKRAEVLSNALEMQKEDVELKKTKLDLFKDILPSIQTHKRYLFDEKDYNSFVVNRMLSYHLDSVFYANEMNRLYDLPKKMQYDYYFHNIRSKKRPYTPWIRSKKIEDLDAVKTYFGYSNSKAINALQLLNNQQLEIIRKETTTY